MSEKQLHYLNEKLLRLLNSQKSKKIGIIGRGGGKSTYVGYELYQTFSDMPRSLGALYGPTYGQILTKIFPSAKKILLSMGLREDKPGSPGHFVIGRRPPKYFRRPYNEPERWENFLTLWTGSAVEFISMDRPDLQRGGSYDYQVFDEAVMVPKKFHDRVTETSLRGNRQYFAKKHRHGMQVYVSSQAHTQQGFWVEDMQWMRTDRGEFAYDRDGNRIPDPEVCMVVGTSYDNVAVLGEKTIARWKRSMPKTIFDIEVMSQRGESLPNGFYPAFSTEDHTYHDGYEYGYDQKSEYGIYVRTEDADRNRDLPLLIALDFNAVQNSLLVAQEQGQVLRFLNEFYHPGSDTVDAWLKDFVAYYLNHRKRIIYMYADPGGNKVQNLDTATLLDRVANYLRLHGWEVHNMVAGKAYPAHMQKQAFFSEVFMETNTRLPRIRMHYSRCKWLIVSIQQAGILPDFKKDKRSETQQIDQRAATHASDAFDYLVWFRYKVAPRISDDGGIRIGGVHL